MTYFSFKKRKYGIFIYKYIRMLHLISKRYDIICITLYTERLSGTDSIFLSLVFFNTKFKRKSENKVYYTTKTIGQFKW